MVEVPNGMMPSLNGGESAKLKKSPKLNKVDNRSKTKIGVKKEKGADLETERVDKTAWTDSIEFAPVFRPTAREFEEPFKYLKEIAAKAEKYGICKIVPPVKPSVPAGLVLNKKFQFTTNVQHLGVYSQSRKISKPISKARKFYRSGRTYTLDTFQQMANKEMSKRFGSCGTLPSGIVEKEFWREMSKVPNAKTVEYGSDIDGSGFAAPSNCPLAHSNWNLKSFAKHSLSSLSHVKSEVPGVTEPMLYCGMLFSQFAWHVEDSFLNSINYHHLGSPKLWYGVPSSDASQFDQVASRHVFKQDNADNLPKHMQQQYEDLAASNFMCKTTMFSPKILIDNGVKVYKIVQEPGEFVLTFPQAYHGGFSTGFNVGEAVNFATSDWYQYGLSAEKRYQRLRKNPVVSLEELLCADFENERKAANEKGLSEELVSAWTTKVHELVRDIRAVCFPNSRKISVNEMSTSAMPLPCSKCSASCHLAWFMTDNDIEPKCAMCVAQEKKRGRSYALYLNPLLREYSKFCNEHNRHDQYAQATAKNCAELDYLYNSCSRKKLKCEIEATKHVNPIKNV